MIRNRRSPQKQNKRKRAVAKKVTPAKRVRRAFAKRIKRAKRTARIPHY